MTGAKSAARAIARAWRACTPARRIFGLNDMRQPYRAAALTKQGGRTYLAMRRRGTQNENRMGGRRLRVAEH